MQMKSPAQSIFMDWLSMKKDDLTTKKAGTSKDFAWQSIFMDWLSMKNDD